MRFIEVLSFLSSAPSFVLETSAKFENISSINLVVFFCDQIHQSLVVYLSVSYLKYFFIQNEMARSRHMCASQDSNNALLHTKFKMS